MSKVVIGHKVLNLEELYSVSCVGSALGVEVVVDSQLYAELSTLAVKYEAASFSELREAAGGDVIKFNQQQIRAILLVKLVQLLKLKKNASKSSVDFILSLLNDSNVSCRLHSPSKEH